MISHYRDSWYDSLRDIGVLENYREKMASTELKIVAEGDCTKEGLETLIRESGIVRGQTILVLFLDGLEFGRWALTNTGHLCLSRETAAKFWSDEALVAENH